MEGSFAVAELGGRIQPFAKDSLNLRSCALQVRNDYADLRVCIFFQALACPRGCGTNFGSAIAQLPTRSLHVEIQPRELAPIAHRVHEFRLLRRQPIET